jgi:hypothetical protein
LSIYRLSLLPLFPQLLKINSGAIDEHPIESRPNQPAQQPADVIQVEIAA